MDFKEIQELINLINRSNLSEFKLKEGEFELLIRTDKYGKSKGEGLTVMPSLPSAPVYVPPPVAPAVPEVQAVSQPAAAPAAVPKPAAQAESKQYKEVRSPMVGTFYRSASPEKPQYVKVGDPVEVGQVVCIVEAMKLFNEIESEVSGTIVKVMVEDAQPVEYDQVLFLVDAK